jgi:deoxyribonuclease V
VAGVDVGFRDQGRTTIAAVAVLAYPSLLLVEQALSARPTSFPYVPGLLSFREIPALLEAMEKLIQLPDLILCDGQGIAHPRRLGIATHLGILTGIPTIGVAKSRLIGSHEEPAEEKGAWVPLLDGEERIGAVLRTRNRVKPLFISCGYRISLETAISYVLACTPKYRLPETTRAAHKLASG